MFNKIKERKQIPLMTCEQAPQRANSKANEVAFCH